MAKNKKGEIPENLREHCFKPGESGNPGGRPRSKPFREAILQLVREEQIDAKLARLLVNAALGKIRMSQLRLLIINTVMDRGEGKPTEAKELSGPGGGPIPLEDCTPDENEARLAALLQKAGINVGSTQP